MANILLVVADDLGRDWITVEDGASGNVYVEARRDNEGISVTPRKFLRSLSFLKRNGVAFSQAWAQPVCSPTRATVFTGYVPCNNGVGFANFTNVLNGNPRWQDQVDNHSGKTLAQLLGDADFVCGMFGKWHLGGGSGQTPVEMGWQEHKGILGGSINNYTNWVKAAATSANPTYTQETVTDYNTQVIVDDALTWVQAQTRSWFLSLTFCSPHEPFHTPPSESFDADGLDLSSANSDVRNAHQFNAMIQSLDYYLLQFLSGLDPEQLADTLVIFFGDNGSPQDVSADEPKSTIAEGGVRVPFMITDGQALSQSFEAAGNPASVTDGDTIVTGAPRFLLTNKLNSIEDVLTNVVDIYPTIADFVTQLGKVVFQPDNLDGVSLWPFVTNNAPVPRNHSFAQSFDTFEVTNPVSGNIRGKIATIRNTTHKLNFLNCNKYPENLNEYQLYRIEDGLIRGIEFPLDDSRDRGDRYPDDAEADNVMQLAIDDPTSPERAAVNELYNSLTNYTQQGDIPFPAPF